MLRAYMPNKKKARKQKEKTLEEAYDREFLHEIFDVQMLIQKAQEVGFSDPRTTALVAFVTDGVECQLTFANCHEGSTKALCI